MIILSAGMPRSGSTWLFNALRLILQKEKTLRKNSFFHGWIDDVSFSSHMNDKDNVFLIKIHNYDETLSQKSTLIFYSYRDIRDVLASMYLKFDTVPSIDVAKSIIYNDANWRKVATYSMRYEDFLVKPLYIIERLLSHFSLDLNCKYEIEKELTDISLNVSSVDDDNYDENTLYHPRHFTRGEVGYWSDVIPSNMLNDINAVCRKWLKDNNYIESSH